MPHVPLSQRLMQLAAGNGSSDGITLDELVERTEGRGVYLLIVLLALPFIIPVALPGVSTVLGGIIFVLSLRLSLGQAPRLPKFLGRRRLSAQMQEKILRGSARFVRFLEKVSRPRRTEWLRWRAARTTHALLIALMALFLALPLPPVLPFSNSMPSYAIILLAVSMMEEDGLLIWCAYVAVALTLVYFGFFGGVFVTLFTKAWQWLRSIWGTT